MTMKDILEQLGEAQGQMILANFNNNREAEEHYKDVQSKLVNQLSKNKGS